MFFRKLALTLAVTTALSASALACTTVVVGEGATADGSFLVARAADSSALKAQHFVIHPPRRTSPACTAPRTMTVRQTSNIRSPRRACATRRCPTGRPSCTAPWASMKPRRHLRHGIDLRPRRRPEA